MPRPQSTAGGLTLGVRAALRGLGMLFSTPRRLLLCLLPAVLAAVAMFAAASFLALHLSWLWGRIADYSGTGAGHTLLAVLLSVLAVGVIAGVMAAAFLGIVAVASAPVSNALSLQAEVACGSAPPELTMGQEAVETARSIWHALLRLAVYLLSVLALSAAAVVFPPLALLTVPLSLVSTGAYLVYDLLDPTLSRRCLGFADKWRFMAAHWGACTGLAAVSMVVLWIPLAGLLLWPGLAMGGAVLFCEVEGK